MPTPLPTADPTAKPSAHPHRRPTPTQLHNRSSATVAIAEQP